MMWTFYKKFSLDLANTRCTHHYHQRCYSFFPPFSLYLEDQSTHRNNKKNGLLYRRFERSEASRASPPRCEQWILPLFRSMYRLSGKSLPVKMKQWGVDVNKERTRKAGGLRSLDHRANRVGRFDYRVITLLFKKCSFEKLTFASSTRGTLNLPE